MTYRYEPGSIDWGSAAPCCRVPRSSTSARSADRSASTSCRWLDDRRCPKAHQVDIERCRSAYVYTN